uniref:RNA-directed RNA polymerase L n=1 Tax=Soybean thrips bunya-like virus 3 TaxID=2802229 RepID=A0A7U0R7C0_9VIRU|nr:RNA-dependent RNA polymerase [Soybean thrips bunya-like virus 3]
MDRFFNRAGKVDRNRAWREGTDIHEDDTVTVNLIRSLCNEVSHQWRALAPSAAVELYSNIQYNRHNLWCDYINRCKTMVEFNCEDTSVELFARRLRTRYDILVPVPDHIKRLSPDILHYDIKTATVFLGDVAVTEVVNITNQNKTTKYFELAEILRSSGLRVCHQNFIVSADLMNIETVVQTYSNIELIKKDAQMLHRYKVYHEMCNQAMREASSRNTNPGEFKRLLSLKEKRPEIDTTIDYESSTDVSPLTPLIDEDTLIGWVKDETDNNLDTYYDVGYRSAEDSFVKLYDGFRNRKHHHPKSTLMSVFNCTDVEDLTGHDLLLDFISDINMSTSDAESRHILNLLPSSNQVRQMKMFKDVYLTPAQRKEHGVYGPWQYDMRTKYPENAITADFRQKMQYGKKIKNLKKEPSTIDPDDYNNCVNIMDEMMNMLGNVSSKPSFLDDSWDAKTTSEFYNTTVERERYDYCRRTNGAQLGQALSQLNSRLNHLRTKESQKDNIFVSHNGSFIAIIPKNHAPFTSSDANCPLIFICRVRKGLECTKNRVHEYEHSFTTMRHTYYVSKLCRLPLSKISHWDQAGHRITACSSYLVSVADNLWDVKEKTVGLVSVILLDVHQKTSELLDLLKYISFMPFSDLSRLSKLIQDKFDVMLKTRLDVWVIKNMEKFMKRLSGEGNVSGIKEKLRVINGMVVGSSLGMQITIPSFINTIKSHNKIQNFIEEISAISIIRGKQFFGSQPMDASITKVATWNDDFVDESEQFKGWVNGRGEGKYPFSASFCYSSDAIMHAIAYRDKMHPVDRNQVNRKLGSIEYNCYPHKVCTLRGCVKDVNDRKNEKDLHTTSLNACLDFYKKTKYKESAANTIRIAADFARSSHPADYSASDKEQRGGHRPICTPTFTAKMGNLAIEKPEQAIGSYTKNNILVAGKNKLHTQTETYKILLEKGYMSQKKFVYQCTEDQTKFSENDNTRKYETYIRNNTLLSDEIKKLQLDCMSKMIGRQHLVKRLPEKLFSSRASKYIIKSKNGVRAIIGWPQGMLNNISTSVHSLCDYWVTYAYNKAYGTNIVTEGLVHSDDSWYAIGCDSLDEFKRFALFRNYAKRLFCLRMNEKKLYGSRFIGELVSNFNINGEVMVAAIKTIANSLNNLKYQNWVSDVYNQVSTLQQAYRQGVNVSTLIMMATVLRQQVIGAYNIKNEILSRIHLLPIEMGGYPANSVFELGVTGVDCHYKNVYDFVEANPTDELSMAILRVMRLSEMYNLSGSSMRVKFELQRAAGSTLDGLCDTDEILDEDFENVIPPRKGDVFSCIQHIIPKSKKVTMTMNSIKSLPFETDGLEMLVTKPRTLAISLGHLKSQMNTLLFSLASEKYTSNKKRLAINQSIQATGKTVRIAGMRSMTITEMLSFVFNICKVRPSLPIKLKVAFNDESRVVDMCHNIVYYSTQCPGGDDKKRIMNRMPDFESKFTTVCRMQSILLFIIDQSYETRGLSSNLLKEHTDQSDSLELLKIDADLIRKRFHEYFTFYKVEYACSLIMQQYFERLKPRLWAQPKLRQDDLGNFLEDLYGKTLSRDTNYYLEMDYKPVGSRASTMLVDSIYTCEVLNKLYPEKFRIQQIPVNGKMMAYPQALKKIDYSELSHAAYLKYSILMFDKIGDDNHLRNYDQRKEYRHYYIKTQKYDGRSYQGTFIVMIQLGSLVMKIEGAPGDVYITVNKPLVDEMLKAMQIYVNKDHRDYHYNFSSSWHSNSFWQSAIPIGQMSLVNYGGNNTIIQKNASSRGISIKIDSNLIYSPEVRHTDRVVYNVTDNMRVVSKIIKDSKVRVDSVRQSMDCPLSSKIQLVPDTIDGFLNVELLRTKTIISATVKNSRTLDLHNVRQLFNTRTTPIGIQPVIQVYTNLLGSVANHKFTTGYSIEPDEAETVIIQGSEPTKLVEMSQSQTVPEDLEAIELEMLYVEEERASATLYKHSNLIRLFSASLSRVLSEYEIKCVYWYMMNNQKFKKFLIRESEEVLSDPDMIREIMDIAKSVDTVPESYFVLANSMDMICFSPKDLVTLIKSPETDGALYLKPIADNLVRLIMSNIADSESSEEDEMVAQLLKHL